MPSRAPPKSRRPPSIPSRAKKTPVLGRLSAALARVKAGLKKDFHLTVKAAAAVIGAHCNVSSSSLATSMYRSKIRNGQIPSTMETRPWPRGERIGRLSSCWPLTLHRCPSETSRFSMPFTKGSKTGLHKLNLQAQNQARQAPPHHRPQEHRNRPAESHSAWGGPGVAGQVSPVPGIPLFWWLRALQGR